MLVINGVQRTGSRDSSFYQIGGTPAIQINRAHIYGFDRDGKKLWNEPVTVEDQCLLNNQPGRLPVLVFACMAQMAIRTSPIGCCRRSP